MEKDSFFEKGVKNKLPHPFIFEQVLQNNYVASRVQRARVPRFSNLKRIQPKAKKTSLLNYNLPQFSQNDVPQPLEGLYFELSAEAD